MPNYRIHGLTVSSAVALPGLLAAPDADAADLACRFAAAPAPGDDGLRHALPLARTDSAGDTVALYRRIDGGDAIWRVRYADGTTFDVSDDARVVCAYTPAGATLADTLTYLYGPVFSLVLRMRGVLALHASAVMVDGDAVLLVGANGAGKSTTAAAFARAGFAVLSDDVVALHEREGRWWASPAYDHVRLWPAAETALFGAGTLPLLTPTWEKRALPLAEFGYSHAAEAARVRAIFILGDRDGGTREPRVEPVPARDALLHLVANAAGSRLMSTDLRRLELEPLGRLVTALPPRRVVAPDDMSCLDALVACLVREAQQGGAAA